MGHDASWVNRSASYSFVPHGLNLNPRRCAPPFFRLPFLGRPCQLLKMPVARSACWHTRSHPRPRQQGLKLQTAMICRQLPPRACDMAPCRERSASL
jgi:hypothetical protein